ncbi:type IV secretory pathway VirB10-like protein [Streptomyces filamentosus]
MSQQYPGPSHPYGPPKKKRSTGATVAMVVGGVFLFLVVLGALVGPEDSKNDKADKPSAPVAKTTPASSPAPETTAPPASPAAPPATTPAPSTPPAKHSAAQLPSFVGMGLQSAQDKAQELGYYYLTSHDALGRSRNQISDRNWKVCSQSPRPGSHPDTTKIDFGTVKLEETCPATDAGGDVEEAGSTMPDFQGKSVKVAREALDSSTSLDVKDVSGEDRVILVESNWQVCSQEPAPGTALTGQPVTLRAVKFGEDCY